MRASSYSCRDSGGNRPFSISFSTNSITKLERKSVPSMSNTATLRFPTPVLPAAAFIPLSYRLFSPGPTRSGRWPELGQRVLGAVVRPGRAHVAAVEYEAVVDIFPIFLGDELLEIFRYLREVALVRKVEALCEPLHVRVGGDALPP